jgi:ribosome biogenesis GTPase
MGECKFNNCQHINEPKCAVIEAVGEGKIAASRYMSYLSMMDDDDNEDNQKSFISINAEF